MRTAVERAQAIHQYTQGDCVIFAVEAAGIIPGAEPVFITDDGGKTGHAMCLLPGGRLFDVRGVFAPGTLHEHCPAEYGGIVFLGRNAKDEIVHERDGLPEPEMLPLPETGHEREHGEASYGDRVFARLAAAQVWAECGE